MTRRTQWLYAVELALAGDWEGAHLIAQEDSDPLANWIHAVLHKIEGDVWNSKYWYARTAGRQYETFADATEELQVIRQQLLQLQ
ncbi:hypothetical protein [Methylophilus aquaticus]|uniref:Uncharacterized protein n=1 Tax=Methylophilus aquaticus TaxID=1971610 RepID=A0ABT9JQH7_9PROT|nr:hypothetical protein [Methylophilus aquaticus]MDP8566812.1 hypothetical protein [Methylophilus aquaticus]